MDNRTLNYNKTLETNIENRNAYHEVYNGYHFPFSIGYVLLWCAVVAFSACALLNVLYWCTRGQDTIYITNQNIYPRSRRRYMLGTPRRALAFTVWNLKSWFQEEKFVFQNKFVELKLLGNSVCQNLPHTPICESHKNHANENQSPSNF